MAVVAAVAAELSAAAQDQGDSTIRLRHDGPTRVTATATPDGAELATMATLRGNAAGMGVDSATVTMVVDDAVATDA